MLNLQVIFKNRRPDGEKLSKCGFKLSDKVFSKDFSIMQGQFILKITIPASGMPDYHVFDAQTSEEYFLARVPGATGTFVGEVNAACEEILSDIAANCFIAENFRNAQTKRVIEYIGRRYGTQPEFLWEKSPEFAAVRNQNKTWFALLGKVERSKFGLSGGGTEEVMNLKNQPEVISARIRERRAYPAYHMNKKLWFSIFLDDSLPDGEIFSLIDESYSLVK